MGLLEQFTFIRNVFWDYNDKFQYMGLGIGALIYLYCTHEQKDAIRRAVCISMLFFFVFVLPPFIAIGRSILGDRNFPQLFLILPFVFLIPYAAISFGEKLKEKKKKGLWIVLCIIFVLLAGDGMGESKTFSLRKKDNVYNVTEEQLEVCNVLRFADENEIVLGADLDIIKAIRRINRQIAVIYGADIENGGYEEEVVKLYAYMEDEIIPLELVLQTAEELGVRYLVWNKWADSSVPIGTFVDENVIQLIGETDNYFVIKLSES